MKGLNWKRIAAMGMALALTFSSTAFAAEVMETTLETETEKQTEKQTENIEENGVEMICYTLETGKSSEAVFHGKQESEESKESEESEQEELLSVKKVTPEEIEDVNELSDDNNRDKISLPHRALIVFQPASYWNQPKTEMKETQSVEIVVGETQENAIVQDNQTETEDMSTDIKKETGSSEEILPVFTLTKKQEETIKKISSLISETVIVINGGTLKDEYMFREDKNIRAVLTVDKKTEEEFLKFAESMNWQKIYEEYQKKYEEAEKKEKEDLEAKKETSGLQNEIILPGSTLAKSGNTLSENETPTIPINGTGGSTTPNSGNPETSNNETPIIPSNNGTSSSNNNGSTTTSKKEITLTMVPELLEEEDEGLYATYTISSPSDIMISEATFTLSYDSTRATYDKENSDAGEDVINDFDYTGTDSSGKVSVTLKSKNGTSKNLNGVLLDFWFDLKNEAKVGDIYNLTLSVNTLKNGSNVLYNSASPSSGTVNVTIHQDSIKAVAYSDEDVEETQTQPQTQPQTQTQAQTEPQKAAKTGDSTNVFLWIFMMCGAAGVCIASRKKTVRKS